MRQLHGLELQFVFVDGGFIFEAVVLPSRSVGEVFVVTFGFTVDLVFGAEVTATGFFAVEGVACHEFTKFDEVDDASSFFEFLVDVVGITGDADVVPEVLAEVLDLLDGFLESFFGAGDTDFVKEDFTESTMETFGRLIALGLEEAVDQAACIVDGGFASIVGGGEGLGVHFASEVIADGVGSDKVSIGETLHERACAEAVCAVIGEVGFAENEESGDIGHQVVVDPETAHDIVGAGVDLHGLFVGIFAHDLVVHIEEVAVFGADGGFAFFGDGFAEVEVDGFTADADAVAFVAVFLAVAGSDVTGNHVGVGGVTFFEEVDAVGFGDLVGVAFVAGGTWNPDASDVTETFAHQGQFGLIMSRDGDASGVDLYIAGITEVSTAFVGTPCCGDVGGHGGGREIVDVGVTARAKEDSMCSVCFDFARHEVTGDDALCNAIFDDQVVHLVACVEFDALFVNFAHQAAVRTEKKLLSGLSACVEGTGNQHTTEGTVGQGSAVFTGKRNALCDALVDDVGAVFSEAVDVGFTGAEVATFDGVVKETPRAVAVVLVVFGGVDSALRGDTVGAARAVVEGEAVDVVALLSQSGSGGSSGQSGSDDDHFELAAVDRPDKTHLFFCFGPTLIKWTAWSSWI